MAETGLLLFTRYALPCAKEEWGSDFEWLKKIAKGEAEPNGWLLDYRFKKATQNYEECRLCRESGYKPDYSRESVENHWLHHHGHESICPVIIGTVTGFIGRNEHDLFEVFTDDTQIVPAADLYNQGVTIGGRVSIHRNMIIQVF